MDFDKLELKYPCVPAAFTTNENSSPKLFNGKPKFSGSDQVESESLLAMKKSDPPIDGLRSETKNSVPVPHSMRFSKRNLAWLTSCSTEEVLTLSALLRIPPPAAAIYS